MRIISIWGGMSLNSLLLYYTCTVVVQLYSTSLIQCSWYLLVLSQYNSYAKTVATRNWAGVKFFFWFVISCSATEKTTYSQMFNVGNKKCVTPYSDCILGSSLRIRLATFFIIVKTDSPPSSDASDDLSSPTTSYFSNTFSNVSCAPWISRSFDRNKHRARCVHSNPDGRSKLRYSSKIGSEHARAVQTVASSQLSVISSRFPSSSTRISTRRSIARFSKHLSRSPSLYLTTSSRNCSYHTNISKSPLHRVLSLAFGFSVVSLRSLGDTRAHINFPIVGEFCDTTASSVAVISITASGIQWLVQSNSGMSVILLIFGLMLQLEPISWTTLNNDFPITSSTISGKPMFSTDSSVVSSSRGEGAIHVNFYPSAHSGRYVEATATKCTSGVLYRSNMGVFFPGSTIEMLDFPLVVNFGNQNFIVFRHRL